MSKNTIFNALFTKCGAKLRLFFELTKYFLYFCTKHSSLLQYFKDFTGENEQIKLQKDESQGEKLFASPPFHGHRLHRARCHHPSRKFRFQHQG